MDSFSIPEGVVAFDSRADLDGQLSREIAGRLRLALERRALASLVVSGGRTPVGLFEALSQEPLDWSRVIVTLADERWVDNDASESNERLVRTHLLQNRAQDARLVALKTPALNADAGEVECRQRLLGLPETLDVVVLGMGEDGHTASLFPSAEGLGRALDLSSGVDCLALSPSTAPKPRMTLTLPRLLRSEQVYLHLCGESKLPVLAQALKPGPVELMPVRALLRQSQVPLAIYWAP